ncbi:MAG: hypothetical protein AAGA96_15215 [Verrucomicrobiota bacterium]
MNDEQTQQLRDFIALVDELEAMPFWQSVASNGLSMSGSEGAMEIDNLDEDQFRSFLLSFRLLIQDNEPTSVRRIWKLVRDHGTDNDLWAGINGPRWMINDFQEREMWPVPGGEELSFLEIRDTFLYGSYAHRKPEHRTRLEEWEAHPDQFALLKLQFMVAIKVIVECARKMANAIQNPGKSTDEDDESPRFDESNENLKDRTSIRLAAAGIKEDPVALEALRKRILLLRELNGFLGELGREDEKGCCSMNTGIEREMLDPEGAVLGGDAGYQGARISFEGTELDPDRSIQFAIGFLDDWRISVKVSSSVLPSEVIDLDAEEGFERVKSVIENHHAKIFDGWPLSDEELATKAETMVQK